MMSNTRDFILNQVMWIGISIALSLLISLFVPFPFSLIGIVIVLVLMGYYFRKRRFVWDKQRY
jgi:4-hydroxybenzoate polyprenyltransferase